MAFKESHLPVSILNVVPSTSPLSSAIGNVAYFGWWDVSKCNISRGFKRVFAFSSLACLATHSKSSGTMWRSQSSLFDNEAMWKRDKLFQPRPLRLTSSQVSHLLIAALWITQPTGEANRRTPLLSLAPKPKLLAHRITSK